MAAIVSNKKGDQEQTIGLLHPYVQVGIDKEIVFFYTFLNDYIQFGNSTEKVIDVFKDVWKRSLLERNQ